jgi:hypothetical protein
MAKTRGLYQTAPHGCVAGVAFGSQRQRWVASVCLILVGCTRYLPTKLCKDKRVQLLIVGFVLIYILECCFFLMFNDQYDRSNRSTRSTVCHIWGRCGVHATNMAPSSGAVGAFKTVGVCVGRVGVRVVDRHGQPHPCIVLVPAGRRQTDLGKIKHWSSF